jgi:hypothetical protein
MSDSAELLSRCTICLGNTTVSGHTPREGFSRVQQHAIWSPDSEFDPKIPALLYTAILMLMRVYGTLSTHVSMEYDMKLPIHIQRVLVDTFNANACEASTCTLRFCRIAQLATKQLHPIMRYVAFLLSRVLHWRPTRLSYDESHKPGGKRPAPA